MARFVKIFHFVGILLKLQCVRSSWCAGVPSLLVERRLKFSEHPQAHFLNNRTMEVRLSCHLHPMITTQFVSDFPSGTYFVFRWAQPLNSSLVLKFCNEEHSATWQSWHFQSTFTNVFWLVGQNICFRMPMMWRRECCYWHYWIWTPSRCDFVQRITYDLYFAKGFSLLDFEQEFYLSRYSGRWTTWQQR